MEQKGFKISASYWNSLKDFEQNYLIQRVNSGKDNISGVKSVISNARKLHPDYIKIWGQGFIETPDGKIFLYSGNDTKRFHPMKINQDGSLEFINK